MRFKTPTFFILVCFESVSWFFFLCSPFSFSFYLSVSCIHILSCHFASAHHVSQAKWFIISKTKAHTHSVQCSIKSKPAGKHRDNDDVWRHGKNVGDRPNPIASFALSVSCVTARAHLAHKSRPQPSRLNCPLLQIVVKNEHCSHLCDFMLHLKCTLSHRCVQDFVPYLCLSLFVWVMDIR